MKKWMAVLTVWVSMFMFSFGVTAAENKDFQYTYGTVIKVVADQMTIKEFNLDKEGWEDVTYTVDSTVRFMNFSSLGDLKEGENVEIRFFEENGKKNVDIISIEKTES